MVAAGDEPATYTWTWGDDTPASQGAAHSHAFPLTDTAQTYTVTMSASNTCSGPVSVSQAIRVSPHSLFLPMVIRNP